MMMKLPQYTFGWKGGLMLIVGAMGTSVLFLIIEAIYILMTKESLIDTHLWFAMLLNFSGMIGAILAFDFFCCKSETKQRLNFNLSWKHRKSYYLTFPIMLGMMLIADFFTTLIPTTGIFFGELYERYTIIFQKLLQNIPLLIISTVILAPILEEIIFRGIIQKGLINKGWRPVKAIWFSAAIFGIIHGNPWQLVGGVLLGFVLGEAYYRTGSLLLSILLHSFNNLLSCLMLIFFQEESFSNLLNVSEYLILLLGCIVFFIFYFWYLKINKKISFNSLKE